MFQPLYQLAPKISIWWININLKINTRLNHSNYKSLRTIRKQRNLPAPADTSTYISLSTNEASILINEELNLEHQAMATEIKHTLEEKFNQLKDGLIQDIKKSLLMKLKG